MTQRMVILLHQATALSYQNGSILVSRSYIIISGRARKFKWDITINICGKTQRSHKHNMSSALLLQVQRELDGEYAQFRRQTTPRFQVFGWVGQNERPTNSGTRRTAYLIPGQLAIVLLSCSEVKECTFRFVCSCPPGFGRMSLLLVVFIGSRFYQTHFRFEIAWLGSTSTTFNYWLLTLYRKQTKIP